MVMCIGACAGSTGGGFKVSRVIILFKSFRMELEQLIHPKQMKKVKMDGRPIEHEMVRSVSVYLVCFVLVFGVSMFVMAFDNLDLVTNFSAVLACLNNVGPGLEVAGPMSNYAVFSTPAKLVLIFDMLAGRLELFPILLELTRIRRAYERVRPALEEAEATGYGIIMPEAEELTLEEPEMIKQGGRYGVRLQASAPSLHILRAGIQTTVCPIVGSEKQSEELVLYLLREFEENPAKIWESNIFGKSLHELVNEGLHTKLAKMPTEARLKLQETLERVINEGCSGLICFIL